MITFSSDTGLTHADVLASAALVEEHFQTAEDEEQAPVTLDQVLWIEKNIPECLNVIKDGSAVIGETFMFPATRALMEQFLRKEINEKQLMTACREHVTYKNADALYLASAIVLPAYRRQGLALQAFLLSITKAQTCMQHTPALFCWVYSPEGAKLAQKIAQQSGLTLHMR